MSTKLSVLERQQIIYEILLVAMGSSRVINANSPKVDLFWVLKTVLTGGAPFRCTTKQTMISVLRKSPVWSKVKPFLEYSDSTCDRKGCQCGEWIHESGTGKCNGHHYVNGYSLANKVPCQCLEFIPKDFK